MLSGASVRVESITNLPQWWECIPLKLTDVEEMVFITAKVRLHDHGGIYRADLVAFRQRVLTAVVRTAITGRFAEGFVLIPLADKRYGSIGAYLHAGGKTKDELNALVGEDVFVDEGEIGRPVF